MDDPLHLDKIPKDQYYKGDEINNSIENSRLITVSGQGFIEERNDSRGRLHSPKTFERRKKLTNSKEKDTFNSNSLQCNNEDLVVEIKKLKASNSFTNKIVESAVKSQEKKDDLNKTNNSIKKK